MGPEGREKKGSGGGGKGGRRGGKGRGRGTSNPRNRNSGYGLDMIKSTNNNVSFQSQDTHGMALIIGQQTACLLLCIIKLQIAFGWYCVIPPASP